jgi:hypothetical protein
MKPSARTGLVAVVAVAAACFEMSAPADQLAAISPIILPWPAVVVDDALRDSLGNTTPLRVDAFDGSGNEVEDAAVHFIALDTGLTVEAAGIVIGTVVRQTPARIVAQVSRGTEVLQTPTILIHVVPRPDSVSPSSDTTFAAKPIPATDPAPIRAENMVVKVLSRTGAGAVGVPGWIVRYDIVRQPPGLDGRRTALFTEQGVDSVSVDTTETDGTASRTIELQRLLVASTNDPEYVEVQATIRRVGNNTTTTTFKFILPFDRQ